MFLLIPGKQPLNYYLCSGNPESIDLNKLPFKLNWPLVLVQLFSVLLHLVISIKIYCYKKQLRKLVPVIQNTEHIKQLSQSKIDSVVITDFATNIFCVLIIGTLVIISSYLNKMSLAKVSLYPYYFLVYAYKLLFPSILTVTVNLVSISTNNLMITLFKR